MPRSETAGARVYGHPNRCRHHGAQYIYTYSILYRYLVYGRNIYMYTIHMPSRAYGDTNIMIIMCVYCAEDNIDLARPYYISRGRRTKHTTRAVIQGRRRRNVCSLNSGVSLNILHYQAEEDVIL